LIAGINDLSGKSHPTHPIRKHFQLTVSLSPRYIGNTPPWKLKAKSNYLAIDSQRARERVGLHGLAFPKDFMSMALTVSPQRALHYIKANYPSSTFIASMAYLNQQMWTPPHVNLTQDENLRRVLLEATATAGGKGKKKLFTEKQVDEIMVGRGEMKGILKAKTEEVVQLGAFGAPWMWVTNAKGESSPFFGSDR
jgi:glutathione S-transferase kappa 1